MDAQALISEFQKSSSRKPSEIDLIEHAFDFSQKAHQGQKRESGEPYFNHSFETALKIVQWHLDTQTVAAGLLHDVVEAGIEFDELKKEFGEEISFLVEGVTKLGHLKYRIPEARQAENLRKMLLAISQDIRVIIIKLADRLHNMKTLKFLPPQKQKRIALETYEIYAPLAYRLGMQNLAGELEDLSFFYLYPEEYKWLLNNVKDRYEERQKYLERVEPIIRKALKDSDIEPIKIDLESPGETLMSEMSIFLLKWTTAFWKFPSWSKMPIIPSWTGDKKPLSVIPLKPEPGKP